MIENTEIVPRRVAVAIPFRVSSRPSEPARFLLVSSRKHPDFWVFPKGQIEVEVDGNDPARAALREAWEEAGIRGKVIRLLHRSRDLKAHKHATNHFVPRAEYSFWLMEVSEELQEWPECSERRRKWVTRQEASDLVAWRNDGQVDALKSFSTTELC